MVPGPIKAIKEDNMDYSKLTNEKFDQLLLEEVRHLSAEEILAISGVYEILSEEFNNAILEAWKKEQEEEE